MKPTLARKLIAKGVIQRGTEVDAYFNAHGLSGQMDQRIIERFVVRGARATSDGKVFFEGLREGDDRLHRFPSDNIVKLDGMTTDRVAAIYNLSEDGEEATTTRRRGRKPRSEGADQAAGAEADG